MDDKDPLHELTKLLELREREELIPEQQERLSKLLEPLIEDVLERHKRAFEELSK